MSYAHAEGHSRRLADHGGPYSEAEYLALPKDHLRIELLDGGLLVNPPADVGHQRLSLRLAMALDAALPPGHEVLENVGVRVGPAQILIPDLVVITDPGIDVKIVDPADVVLAVEIVSPGSVARDRAVKPRLYAQAGIPHYLRIEPHVLGPRATVSVRDGDRYVETATARPSEQLVLTEPFPVTLDLARLARTTRAGG